MNFVPMMGWGDLTACGEARHIHDAGLPDVWVMGGAEWDVMRDGLYFRRPVAAPKAQWQIAAEEWEASNRARELQHEIAKASFFASEIPAPLAEWVSARGIVDPCPADYVDALASMTLSRAPSLCGVITDKRQLAAISRRAAELTLKQLGFILGVGAERARQICLKAERRRPRRRPGALPPPRPFDHPDFGEQSWTPLDQYAEFCRGRFT